MTAPQTQDRSDYRVLPTRELTPHPDNPPGRVKREALADLAATIRAQGIQQPIVCRQVDGGFQIVFGHRRWAAAKMLGLPTVPVLVRAMTDTEALEAQLAENAGRQELDPMEQAHAYKTYLHRTKATQAQLARRLGVTQGTVSAALALLTLPEPAVLLLHQPGMTAAHGRELVRLKGKAPAMDQVVAQLKRVLSTQGVPSSKALRDLVSQVLANGAGRPKPGAKAQAKRGRKPKAARVTGPTHGPKAQALVEAAHGLALGVRGLSHTRPVKVPAPLFARAERVLKLMRGGR